MKPKRETLIRAISIKLLEQPQGATAVKALDKAIALGMIKEWEADDIFKEAEEAAYPTITDRTFHTSGFLRVGCNESKQRPPLRKYSSVPQCR